MKENSILIDTDILIELLKANDKIIPHIKRCQDSKVVLHISILTYYECLRGYKIIKANKKLQLFQVFVSDYTSMINLDTSIIEVASDIYAYLRENGHKLPENDILIAATAITNKIPLITNNEKDFRLIASKFKLNIENWLK